jgi:hypothetical protein
VEPVAGPLRPTVVMRLGLGLGLLVLAVSACGSSSSPEFTELAPGSGPGSPTSTTTSGPDMSGGEVTPPPPFRLRYEDQELALQPYTWCYSNGCADGVADDPPSVGSPGEVRVFVPVRGWDLVATFVSADKPCGREQTVEPTREDGWFVLRPVGHAGRYNVDLFAQGRGDMVSRFVWDTRTDGELATPHATLAVIADHDGRPDSYGVELMLQNLAATPESASARVTVTAAGGRAVAFDATRSRQDCIADGSVYFDGPDAKGKAAAALGDFPFHYDVTVTLDGVAYHASADYPDDEIHGNEPSVALEFSPPLPAPS